MTSNQLPSEIVNLRDQLKSLTDEFNEAIQKDVELWKLKEMLHQIKSLRVKLQDMLHQYNVP